MSGTDPREDAVEALKNLVLRLLDEAAGQVSSGVLVHVHDTLNAVQKYVGIMQELKTRK